MNLSFHSLRPTALAAGVVLALAFPSASSSLLRGAAADPAPPAGWDEIAREPNVVVYGKTREGSSIRELRAIGTLDAPNWVVKNVIDDGDHYADFMPNVLESKVIERDTVHHTAVAYAKLSAPLISPRDYVLLIHDESHAGGEGGAVVYKSHWEPSPKGPAEKPGVVRIKINEGSWTLEPTADGQKTRATYQLYTDGGGLPAFVLNQTTKRRIGEEFTAIEKRAQQPQYRKSKPAYP